MYSVASTVHTKVKGRSSVFPKGRIIGDNFLTGRNKDMTDYSEIARNFVLQYYQRFDADRSTLHPFYNERSTQTFEGVQSTGADDITKKLVSLPFKVVQHAVTTYDHQITVDGGLIVFVVGQLKSDDDPPHGFSQVFHLKQVGASLFILNDFFRLSIHHQ